MTATIGKHAQPGAHDRGSWFGRAWRRRRQQAATTGEPQQPAVPSGPFPYGQPSDADITEMVGQLRPLSPQPAFTGASLAGQPDGTLLRHPPDGDLDHITGPRLPDGTGELAAIREDAVPGPVRILQRTRDGLRDLDEPGPLAFIRHGEADGGFGRYWPVGGEPAFLGLEQAGDRTVAQVCLGVLPDGSTEILAGDVAGIDARIAVLMVARDRLAYGSGISTAPDAGEPETVDPEPEPAADAPADPGGEETAAGDHAALTEQADEVLGRADKMAGHPDVKGAANVLIMAVNLYKSAAAGTIDPSMLFEDLVHQDGSREEAMARLKARLASAQAALTEAIGKYCGDEADEAAEHVRGQAGGAL